MRCWTCSWIAEAKLRNDDRPTGATKGARIGEVTEEPLAGRAQCLEPEPDEIERADQLQGGEGHGRRAHHRCNPDRRRKRPHRQAGADPSDVPSAARRPWTSTFLVTTAVSGPGTTITIAATPMNTGGHPLEAVSHAAGEYDR